MHRHKWRETSYNKKLDKFYYRCLDCPKAITLYGDIARAVAQATEFKLKESSDTKDGE